MKQYFLFILVLFASFNFAFGQSPDHFHSNIDADGSDKMTVDRSDISKFIAVERGADGSARFIFRGDNPALKNISLIIIDDAIAKFDQYIDPDNVESAKVIDGSEATALYGSRGANGALVIYTKLNKIPGSGSPNK